MTAKPTRIGFIGAGKMATALAQGWISAGITKPQHCCASDPNLKTQKQFAAATGSSVVTSNRKVAEKCEILVLAVKPQNMNEVLREIRSVITARHLVISIAAGVSIDRIAKGIGSNRRLVRVMPNVACLVHAGAGGYAASRHAKKNDVEMVDQLFNSVGRAMQVPEELLDAVTGLSGSGPAFVCMVIEALSDGGVLAGLPREVASILATQTVLGTAKMILEANLHPAVLKDQVASPGGTTIAGLQALERGGLRAALMDAVAAATRRSHELGTGQ